jgi:cyclohexanone monooxygenase
MSSVYGTALPPMTNAEVVDIENLTSGNGIHRSLDVPPLDIEAIEAKNRAERDKRINRKGPQQFREATGKLARFGEDVWAPPIENREPVDEDVEVLIIGCGHGGIIAAKNLHDRGIYNIRMVDQASDFGGVWYWNRFVKSTDSMISSIR